MSHILKDILVGQGVPEEQAEKIISQIGRAKMIVVPVEAIDPLKVELVERNRRIYNLRAVAGVSEALVAQRFNLDIRHIRRIVKRQIILLRTA